MRLKAWGDLPPGMQCDEVRKFYDILSRRKVSLVLKRFFDVSTAAVLLIVLFPAFLMISIAIALDSKGGVLFIQERVTMYGKRFRICKFRTMVANAEKLGALLTAENDKRVTNVGKFLRGSRLDEIPQLINVITGDMSFVGTRPEVPKYVEAYTPEMLATLLLPAGVTSEVSIMYKDEYKQLSEATDIDRTYVEKVLPGKMYYNLMAIENFNFWQDIRTMFRTVFAVCGKEYNEQNSSMYTTRKRM